MAKANEAAQAGTADDLYHKLLAYDPETHWDQIVSDMHTMDPWADLICVNSLTAMAGICSNFFFELRASLITFRIFVR